MTVGQGVGKGNHDGEAHFVSLTGQAGGEKRHKKEPFHTTVTKLNLLR